MKHSRRYYQRLSHRVCLLLLLAKMIRCWKQALFIVQPETLLRWHRERFRYGQTPKYLIRDHDSKFGPNFERVAVTSGIKILKTPYRIRRANAICERFLRSVRQESLDHLLIFDEKQLQRVLNEYVVYFNRARPHQGIGQQIPEQYSSGPSSSNAAGKVIARPVMGGLHHDYQWAA